MLGLYRVIGCLIVVIFTTNLSAQDADPPVTAIHYFNEKTQTFDIYCENTGPDTYSVELDFEKLNGLRPSVPFPLRKTIEPGRHLLMRLSQREVGIPGSFQIALSYRRGNLVYEITNDFPYLPPLKAGSIAKMVCKDSLLSYYPPPPPSGRVIEKDTCFHISGFFLQNGDSIYASRRGIVSKINNLTTDTAFAEVGLGYYLDIQHVDGTYARYDGIAIDSLLVEMGQEVEAGDPIARVQTKTSGCPFFSFRVFCYKEKVVTDKIGPLNTKMVTVPVYFQGAPSTSCGQFYKVVHPKETITREMSKRDLRKWMKRQGE